MEKQDKVLKKIKSVGSRGSGLNLGVKKNDECYTDMQDILNELSQWAALGKFKGKNIICPCDWDVVKPKEGEDPYCTVGGEQIDGRDIYSITITYNEPGIEVVGNSVFKAVKSVYVDIWSKEEDTKVEHLTLVEDEIEDFLRGKLTCNFVRTLTQNARAWGIQSITASGYNPATNCGVRFQDVDYSKYDICVTNPPFSLYAEFMTAIIGNIDFIVLAPFLDRKSTFIGIPLMEQKAFIGFSGDSSAGYLPMCFANPTKENAYNTKKVACDWVTSFDEAQVARNQRLAGRTSGISFDLYKDEYDTLPGMVMKDKTTPIKVPCHAIPDDYSGWMFSAINVLTKMDLTAYEWYITNFTSYYNYDKPSLSPFSGKIASKTIHQLSNGKDGFCGIVFRKKP